jgi:hypothetical protein
MKEKPFVFDDMFCDLKYAGIYYETYWNNDDNSQTDDNSRE